MSIFHVYLEGGFCFPVQAKSFSAAESYVFSMCSASLGYELRVLETFKVEEVIPTNVYELFPTAA